MTRRLAGGLAFLCVLAAPAWAAAQSEGGGGGSTDAAAWLAGGSAGAETAAEPTAETPPAGETPPATDPGGTGASGDADVQAFLQGGTQGQAPLVAAPEVDPDTQLEEQQGKPYYELGLRAHYLFIPGALVEAFGLESFEDVHAWGTGLQFTYRKDAFEIITSVWYGDYKGDVFTREVDDPIGETEHLGIDLGVVWFNVDFMTGWDITPWVGFYIGGGLGFGATIGDIYRDEAWNDHYNDDPSVRQWDGNWHACGRAGSPRIDISPEREEIATGGGFVRDPFDHDIENDDQFCEENGGHYGPVERRIDGIWEVYPQVDLRLSFRWKPWSHLTINFPDFGLGLPSLFFLGGTVNYLF